MSELNDRYDRGAVTDRIIPPPFAELAGRARRRTRRHRTARLAGVAVLAALVAAPLLTIQGGGSTPPAQFADVQFPPELENAVSRGLALEFYDTRHGFVTYSGDSCNRSWISATRDGGASWSDVRDLPRFSEQELSEILSLDPAGESLCFQPYLVPIAEETLVMPGTVAPQYVADWLAPPVTAYISHDAGETWQVYQPAVKVVEEVPDGVRLGWHCEDAACDEPGLGWYDPATGDRMVLQNSPAGLAGQARRPTVATDGSIWVAEADGVGGLRVLVSEDRGRSWEDRSPDQLGTVQVGAAAFTTSDGETAYLWAPAYGGPERPSALYRTSDGGETWQQPPTGQPFTATDGMRIARDGTLVVSETDSGTQYVSGDGGETFQATDRPLWGFTRLASGWYGLAPADSSPDPIHGYLSEDGLTWQPVVVPVP